METKILAPKMTEQELVALRERNEQRLKAAIAAMGSRWLLHPDNQVKRTTGSNK